MPESYWEKRFKAIEEKSFEEAEKCIKESVKYIDDAVRSINKEILFWLNRFAKNNNISLAEAKKLITLKDLEELGWDVSKYIAKGSNNKTGEYTQELENASASHHITRLEAIKQQMNEKCEKGFGNVEKSLSSTLLKVYEDTYYKTAYEVQKKVGIGFSFAQVDEKKLKTILEKPWASDGSNFSDRIWKSYKPKLVNNMQKKLVDWCINGTDVQKLTDNLAKESEVVEKACATLIHTEVSNICNQSQADSYKEMGVEKYKNLETLDGITCKVCGGHDGEVHDVDEFQVGLTAPPFHPRCRGTTIPVTDNLLSKNRQRAARDPETGKTVYVNEMTYEEWKENFVNEKGQQAWDYYSKSAKNLKIDTEQLDRYKAVLGKNAPKSLEEFQKIKYTGKKEWELFKAYTNSIKSGELTPLADFNLYKEISEEIDEKLVGIVTSNNIVVNGKSKHFISRVIGSVEQKRNGVPVNDVYNILKKPDIVSKIIERKNGKSIRFIKKGVGMVSLNPENGNLIQVNPKSIQGADFYDKYNR